jgi:hypothetical protein
MKTRHALATVAVALLLTPVVLLGAALLIPVALVVLAVVPGLGVAGLPALLRVASAARRAVAYPRSLPAMRVYSCATGSSARRTAAPVRRSELDQRGALRACPATST